MPQSGNDLAIIALDYSAIMEESLKEIKRKDNEFDETHATLQDKQDEVFEKVVDRFARDIAWVTEPKQMNSRLDRQAGSFLLSGNREKKINDILSNSIYADVEMYKYRINHSLYRNVFALLRKMNITSKSLFGDLDGLACSIKMEMQVYSV